MPHGHCFFWEPSLVWLHVVSDSLIAAAYFSIPFTLYYCLRKRPDVRLRGVILMFAGFILACGMTHVLSVWNIWHSAYRLEGVMKGITAAISVTTALVLVRLVPTIAKLASPEQLQAINQKLRDEIEARNVAEEKLHRFTEAELIASKDTVRSFFDAAPQGILGVSDQGLITMVNSRLEDMFGYSRAELIGQTLEILLPERFRPNHLAHRDGYFAEPRARAMGAGMDLAGRRKDGTEFPIEIGLSHVNTPAGPVAFGMISDISARKKAADEIERVNDQLRRSNAALAISEERFRTFLESAPVAVIGIAADGSIALVNRRTEQVLGYSRDELLGHPGSMLHSERERPAYQARIAALLSAPPSQISELGASMEMFMRRKDGTEFPFAAGVANLSLPEGRLAFGMITDISESKKAADDLRRANEELRRSNIEIEQFAHIASHDLQEPLRMVTGYLQLIERRYANRLDDTGKEFIGFAVDGAKRMKALIRDLLEFSRAGRHAAKFQAVDIGLILGKALSNLKTAIEECGAEITAGPLPTIIVDPILLTQVFQNLIANALKFHKDTLPRVHISAIQEGKEWIFSIRDNGIGIDAHHLGRIFEIFERLHSTEEYAGSGIGLAITKKIVERHQGRIWVESEPGVGSTFFFSLSAEMVIADQEQMRRLSATT
jgi:PAS domain S-box-containing protein